MPERRRTPPDRRRPADRRQRDRRTALRQASRGRLRLLRSGLNDHEVLAGELRDVSPTGVRLETDRPLHLGERVLVEIRESGQRCFNLPAEVVWIDSQAGRRPAIGCELRLDLTRKQFALLRDMISAPEA